MQTNLNLIPEPKSNFAKACLVILILLCIIFLCSCITEKHRAKICATCPAIIKDSIRIETETEYRDTIIYITRQGPKVILPNPCAELCDSLGRLRRDFKPVIRRENGLTTTLKVENNTLVADCKADSLKAEIERLNQFIKETRSQTITRFVEKNVLTRLQGFWIICGQIASGLVLIILGWLFVKRRFNL